MEIDKKAKNKHMFPKLNIANRHLLLFFAPHKPLIAKNITIAANIQKGTIIAEVSISS